MIITIDVTAEDIAEGERGSCEFCPVAMALSRLCRVAVEVHAIKAHFQPPSGNAFRASRPLPLEARRFISNFDAQSFNIQSELKPFFFTLDIPDQFLKPEILAAAQAQ